MEYVIQLLSAPYHVFSLLEDDTILAYLFSKLLDLPIVINMYGIAFTCVRFYFLHAMEMTEQQYN